MQTGLRLFTVVVHSRSKIELAKGIATRQEDTVNVLAMDDASARRLALEHVNLNSSKVLEYIDVHCEKEDVIAD